MCFKVDRTLILHPWCIKQFRKLVVKDLEGLAKSRGTLVPCAADLLVFELGQALLEAEHLFTHVLWCALRLRVLQASETHWSSIALAECIKSALHKLRPVLGSRRFQSLHLYILHALTVLRQDDETSLAKAEPLPQVRRSKYLWLDTHGTNLRILLFIILKTVVDTVRLRHAAV